MHGMDHSKVPQQAAQFTIGAVVAMKRDRLHLFAIDDQPEADPANPCQMLRHRHQLRNPGQLRERLALPGLEVEVHLEHIGGAVGCSLKSEAEWAARLRAADLHATLPLAPLAVELQ